MSNSGREVRKIRLYAVDIRLIIPESTSMQAQVDEILDRIYEEHPEWIGDVSELRYYGEVPPPASN